MFRTAQILMILFFMPAIIFSQIKVGSNPTTIGINSNLETEATDGTKMVVQKDNGNVGIGTATPSDKLHVVGDIRAEGETWTGIKAFTYSNSTEPYFVGFRAGGTKAAPTYPLANTTLTSFVGRDALDGVTLGNGGANIVMNAEENFSTTAKGTTMYFGTTPLGSNVIAERMRITANGNVGIGTSTPDYLLTVGSAAIPGSITIYNDNYDNDWLFHSSRSDGSNNIGIDATESAAPGGMTFWTGAAAGTETEKARITAGGNMGIGTTTPLAKLEVKRTDLAGTVTPIRNVITALGTIVSSNGYNLLNAVGGTTLATGQVKGLNIDLTGSASTTDYGVYANGEDRNYFSGNVGIGTATPTEKLHVVGNILASGTITPSDARFKENVVGLTGSLAKINALRGVSYTHKAEFVKSRGLKEGNQIGFIAQELEKTFPEFVVTSSDGYKAVDYARLTPVLVEAIKEISAKNEKLTAQVSEIETLKAEMASIKALLSNSKQDSQSSALLGKE